MIITIINSIIKPVYKTNDVNPEKGKYLLGVRAEEEILAVLMAHPDLLPDPENLSSNDFISKLNGRIFDCLAEVSKSGGRFDISFLGDEFTTEEIGYIASLQNRQFPFVNPERTLKEAVNTLREEKSKQITASADNTQDWEEQMKKIIENKRRNNNG